MDRICEQHPDPHVATNAWVSHRATATQAVEGAGPEAARRTGSLKRDNAAQRRDVTVVGPLLLCCFPAPTCAVPPLPTSTYLRAAHDLLSLQKSIPAADEKQMKRCAVFLSICSSSPQAILKIMLQIVHRWNLEA